MSARRAVSSKETPASSTPVVVRLTRDQILATLNQPLPSEDVQVPEWGGTVRVKTLNLLERESIGDFLALLKNEEERGAALKSVVIMATVVDEAGVRIFPDFKEYPKLLQAPGSLMERVWKVANRLNRIWGVEGPEGNSNSTPNASGDSV